MKRHMCLLGAGAVLLTVSLLSGCQSSAGSIIAMESPAASPPSPSISIQPSPSADTAVETVAVSQQSPPHADKSAQTTLSSESQPSASPNAENEPKPEGKPYSNEHPSLLGLTLEDNREIVAARFGKPNDTYTMDGDAESISVSDYGSFSIGFRPAGTIVFIDVSTDGVETGIGSVRVGQKADEIEKALGKPDVKSAYTLTYESKKTVLKVDVDPKTRAILSIKLFARDE